MPDEKTGGADKPASSLCAFEKHQQLIHRHAPSFISHVLDSFRQRHLSATQAAEQLGLSCSRLYALSTDDFRARAHKQAAFSWLLVFWLDSRVTCRIKIRLDSGADVKAVYGFVQSLLVSRDCRLQSSALYKSKRQMVFLLHIPSRLDPKQLESDVRAKLPKSDDSEISIRVG